MARNLLTPRAVHTAGLGDHADGEGLFLRVGEAGASWAFRYTGPSGRRREMGLGRADRSSQAAAGKSVSAAREKADLARKLLEQSPPIDPLDKKAADREDERNAKQAEKAAKTAERTTLARHARAYHESQVEPQRSTKHSAQWISSLEKNLPIELWNKPIDSIEPPELLKALAALQLRVPETASRVRQRLEAVFDDAQFLKLCSSNPAQVIRKRLARQPKGREKGNFAALPYAQMAAFADALRKQPGTAARALEFGMLTAARTGEILSCRFSEIDVRAGTWVVPAARMKGGEEHTVFLPPRAVEIVEQMREGQSEFVFPSPIDRRNPLSNMAMLSILRRMKYAERTTVHGLCRATFSTWANEFGIARPDVIEACLAHSEQDRVRKAYNRASFNVERRNLLLAWQNYCNGEKVDVQEQSAGAAILALKAA
jgi:integrase